MKPEAKYYRARPWASPPRVDRTSKFGDEDIFATRAEAVGYIMQCLSHQISVHQERANRAEAVLHSFCEKEEIEC